MDDTNFSPPPPPPPVTPSTPPIQPTATPGLSSSSTTFSAGQSFQPNTIPVPTSFSPPPPPPPVTPPTLSPSPFPSPASTLNANSFSPPPPPPPTPPSTPIPTIPSRPRTGALKKIFLFVLGLLLLVGAVFALTSFTRKNQNVTLTYWGLWESDAIMRPVLDEFEKLHPNIKVEYSMQSLNEYRERLKNSLSRGPGPDLFRIHNSWVPMFRDDLSSVPADVYSAADFESLFYPAVKDTLRVGSNYVAVPLEYDGLAMFVNDELFAQNSVSVPANWDDLRKVALAMSRCESEDGACRPGSRILISGAALGTTNNVDHWQDVVSVLLLQNNVPLTNISGKSAEDVMEYYSNFSRSLGIWDSTLSSSTQLFAEGKVGVYFGHSWRVFDIKALNPNLKYSIHPIPQLPIDPQRGEKPITWASFWVEGVNVKSPHTKEAWELLKYLSSSEVLTRLYDQAVSQGRDFGELYSRKDMVGQLANNPLASPFIQQASQARSWYIASATQDGNNGLNTLLSNAFANVINRQSTVPGLGGEIQKILSQFGVSVPLSGSQ